MSTQGKLPVLGVILRVAFGMFGALPTLSAATSSTPAFVVKLAHGAATLAHCTAGQPRLEVLDGRVYVLVSRQADPEARPQGPLGMDSSATPTWGSGIDGIHTDSRIELGGGGFK